MSTSAQQVLQRSRRAPTAFGWCPARWRHVKRQQFPNTPAMVGDPGGHRGRALHTRATSCRLRHSQTLMRRAEVVDGADQVHAVPQRASLPRQRSAPAGQRRESLAKRRVEALNVGGIDHPVALRAVPQLLNPCGRTLDDAALDSDHSSLLIALDDLRKEEGFPSAKPWTPARTRATRRRIRDKSRCSLTSPPSHNRVLTIIASAIHTMPPCFLTRISSACTCPRSRGLWTQCSCTAWL